MSECKFVRLGTVHGKSQAPKLPEKSWDSSILTGCILEWLDLYAQGPKNHYLKVAKSQKVFFVPFYKYRKSTTVIFST